MAGLLDIFGTGGQDTMGLLGMSPEDIKRNRDDAQAQALYALAGRLFQGGNTGQSIAEGLQLGQKAYKGGMQDVLQGQLQNYQLQDMIRKRQLEQQALMRQQGIESEIAKAYRPQTFAETPLTNLVGQEIAGPNMPQEAGGGLEALAPRLMGSPEGRKALSDLIGTQEAMSGKTTTLAEGASLVRVNPITNKIENVAQGAPKREPVPASIAEYNLAKSQGFAGTFQDYELAKRAAPVPSAIAEYQFAQNQGFKGTFQDYELAKRTAGAPKVSVDLKDPTAVANAQKGVLADWRGVVKDTGSMEVADRFKAAKSAVAEGNAGNKSADGALIYAIGKIYDPSGAVQEGDKATILGNRSIPQSIKAYAQRALNGQSLLPEERAGLLAVASKVVESKARNLEAQKAPYASISQQLGGNGSLLLNPLADALNAPIESSVGIPTAAEIQAEIARRRGK
jgi:hypothetical protein